jgi:hypothetical protein
VSQQLGALQTHTTVTVLFISHTTNVTLFKFRCNIFIGVGIIKEMPGSLASGTPCTIHKREADSPSYKNEQQGIPSGGCKGGRCVGLVTLPPSCVDCQGILEASISWNSEGLPRSAKRKFYLYFYTYFIYISIYFIYISIYIIYISIYIIYISIYILSIFLQFTAIRLLVVYSCLWKTNKYGQNLILNSFYRFVIVKQRDRSM